MNIGEIIFIGLGVVLLSGVTKKLITEETSNKANGKEGSLNNLTSSSPTTSSTPESGLTTHREVVTHKTVINYEYEENEGDSPNKTEQQPYTNLTEDDINNLGGVGERELAKIQPYQIQEEDIKNLGGVAEEPLLRIYQEGSLVSKVPREVANIFSTPVKSGVANWDFSPSPTLVSSLKNSSPAYQSGYYYGGGF